MIEFDRNEASDGRAGNPGAQADELPFRVELWKSAMDVERVLGLAHSAALAQAIFRAAISEHPGRRITLRRGERMIEESRRAD